MKVYKSPHEDVKLPEVDILTLLFGRLAIDDPVISRHGKCL